MISGILDILFSPFGGVSAVMIGMAGFLGKIWVDKTVQKYKEASDAKLSKLQSDLDKASRQLQSELDKGVHIHKVQFEKEFDLYSQIWAQLVEVKWKVLSLRPSFDRVDPSETEEERIKRRLTEFAESFNPFVSLVEKHRPFYPPNVYDALMNLIKISHSEAIGFEYKDRKWAEYWKEAGENQENILRLIDEICEAIRQRIDRVVAI